MKSPKYIKQELLDDASIELEKRLSSGENLLELYVSYVNEMVYLEKADQKDSKRYMYLQNMIVVAADAVAIDYIEHSGWKINDHMRFVRE